VIPSKDTLKRQYLNSVVGEKTRNPRSNTILLKKYNDMTERLNEVGTNEIRPKYNRSVLENQAYYNSN